MKRHVQLTFLVMAVLLIGMKAPVSQVDAFQKIVEAAPPEVLPQELQGITIGNSHIASDTDELGVIQKVTGYVVVMHGSTGQAYFAAEGDAVYRQDKVFTLKDARCRVWFSTNDLITVGENTHISVDEYVDNREIQEKKTVFNMLRGKAMFYVARLFKYKTVTFAVHTPTAVAGVRGTKFGVEVRKTAESTASAGPVYLADTSNTGFLYLAAAPAGWETTVHVFDGEVVVNDQIVGPGQTWSEGTVGPMDPSVGDQFVNDTTGGTDDTTGDGGTQDGNGGGAGDSGTGGSGTGTGGDSTNVSQNLTTLGAEGQSPTGGKQGYFSALLTYVSEGTGLKDVYVSASRQDFDSGSVEAGSIDRSGGYLQGDGRFNLPTPYLTRMVTDGGETDRELGTDHPISHTQMGTTSYMEWGYWTMTTAITFDYTHYAIDNKAYYLFGQSTPDSIAGITGTYSGEAWGTHWDSGYGSQEMTGTFSCSVDLGGSPQINSFNLSVQSDVSPAAASISGGSGTFSGSAFEITGGTWTTTGYGTPFAATDKQQCSGSLYGPNGEQMGGAWGMSNGDDYGAAGIFRGEKSASALVN